MTHVGFSNITGEIKFIESLKYYQKSLAELASALPDEEKMAVKKLTEQFFKQHYFFSTVWPFLNSKKKEKILEIVSEGKGIIPYELIIGMESFFLTEFFSDLKQSAVNENDNKNSKYLYQTLKMRNLCEIIENRFQIMNNTYGFNPRKCKTASSMSGYIQREMPRIIPALPTKLEHVEIFEQTVKGGFSSVNTRLAFDTRILLPNLDHKNELEKNPLNKNFNYKVVYNLKLDGKKLPKKELLQKF